MEKSWPQLTFDRLEANRFKLSCDNEWTVVSSIIMSRKGADDVIVALGVGLKCLSESKILMGDGCNRYGLVRDCHAEVLAKRAFIAFLLENMGNVCEDNIGGGYKIKEGISFGMYSSHVPCGDFSMHLHPPRPSRNIVGEEKHEASKVSSKRPKIIRGRMQHDRLGLRSKPGRIDSQPTKSLSCTDKIARWNYCGINAWGLVSVKLDSFLFGDQFDLKHFEFVLKERWNGSLFQDCLIKETNIKFKFGKSNLRTKASDLCHVWWKKSRDDWKGEWLVEGKRRGSGSIKNGKMPNGSKSTVCTESLFTLYKREFAKDYDKTVSCCKQKSDQNVKDQIESFKLARSKCEKKKKFMKF